MIPLPPLARYKNDVNAAAEALLLGKITPSEGSDNDEVPLLLLLLLLLLLVVLSLLSLFLQLVD